MTGGGRNAAVIVAAGRGERAGPGALKQFRELDGTPVVARAWAPFAACDDIGTLVLVLPPEVAADPPDWLREAPARLVAGGETRTASVARGLAAVPDGTGRVLVHDGVRPFASADLVARVLAEAARGPVVPLLPLRDTVKVVDEGERVTRTLDRSALRRAQTPQGFPATVLREAVRQAERSGKGATDDAALCEAAGATVRGIPGEETNLKLTTAEDFAYAGWLLATGRVR